MLTFRFDLVVFAESKIDLLPKIRSFIVGDALPTDEGLEVSDEESVRP